MASQEVLVPLNDIKTLKRSTSRGSNTDIELEEEGMKDSLDYRIQAVDSTGSGHKISLWHDISLVHIDPQTKSETEYLNFVCEIPKFSR